MISQRGWALAMLNCLSGHGIARRVLEGDNTGQAKKKMQTETERSRYSLYEGVSPELLQNVTGSPTSKGF